LHITRNIPAKPGEYAMRMNSGLLMLISPKMTMISSVKKMMRAAIPQLKPKVSARKGMSIFDIRSD